MVATDGPPLDVGFEAEAQTRFRGAPPGRRENSETRLFKDRRAIAEEGECAGGVGHLRARLRRGQSGAEGWDEPSSAAKTSKEVLVGVPHVAVQGGELGSVVPHRFGGDEQARIVDGLQSELDSPFIDEVTLFGAVEWGEDPEAGSYRVGLDVFRGVPCVKGVAQGLQFVVPGLDGSVGRRESSQPRTDGAGHCWLAPAGSGRGRRRPMGYEPPD